jgi:hypothetical protein
MKLLLFSMVVASATALAADAPSLNGKWNLHVNIAGNESDTMCVFTQKDDALTGSCTSEGVEHPLTGKVDGKIFTWSYPSAYQGSPLTVKYRGTLDETATKLKGTVLVDEYGVDGDFTGEFSK